MKTAHNVGRRLVAGAAGLLIAGAGALAVSIPAHAETPEDLTVTFNEHCDGTTFFISTASGAGPFDWTLIIDGEVEIEETDWRGNRSSFFGSLYAVEFELQVEETDGDGEWTFNHTWEFPADCDPTGVIEDVAELMVVADCHTFSFVVRNNERPAPDAKSSENLIEMHLTPNEDAVHGHAPDLVGLLDEQHDSGIVEGPGDTDLDVVGDVAGGDTVVLGPFSGEESHAHGFEAFKGLEVTVELYFHTDEPAMHSDNDVEQFLMYQRTFAWDEVIADLGVDCTTDDDVTEDPGDETLADTGAPTLLVAGGAVLLLTVGGGLFWLARARRTTFVS